MLSLLLSDLSLLVHTQLDIFKIMTRKSAVRDRAVQVDDPLLYTPSMPVDELDPRYATGDSQTDKGIERTPKSITDVTPLTPVPSGRVIAENHVPSVCNSLAVDQYNHRLHASEIHSLTVEQRLERIEKILARKLNVNYADNQDTGPASESVVAENDHPSHDPLTEHPDCEARFKRLEEQLARVSSNASSRAQRAGYGAGRDFDSDGDASTHGLNPHLHDSHDDKETEHEQRNDDWYGKAAEVQNKVRADLARRRDGREGKDPLIESFLGLDPLDDLDLSGLALRPGDECQVM